MDSIISTSEVWQKNAFNNLSRFLSKKIPQRVKGVELKNFKVEYEGHHGPMYMIDVSLEEGMKNDECQQIKIYNEIESLLGFYGINECFHLKVVGQ